MFIVDYVLINNKVILIVFQPGFSATRLQPFALDRDQATKTQRSQEIRGLKKRSRNVLRFEEFTWKTRQKKPAARRVKDMNSIGWPQSTLCWRGNTPPTTTRKRYSLDPWQTNEENNLLVRNATKLHWNTSGCFLTTYFSPPFAWYISKFPLSGFTQLGFGKFRHVRLLEQSLRKFGDA